MTGKKTTNQQFSEAESIDVFIHRYWQSLNDNRNAIITGTLVWSIILVFLFIVAESNHHFRDFMNVETATFAVTAFTSLFMHNDTNHFVNNITFLIPASVVIFGLLGVKKGSLLLVLTGYAGKLMEFLLITLMNYVLLLLRPLTIQQLGYDPVIGDLFMSLGGGGISGALMGWTGIMLVALAVPLSETGFWQELKGRRFQDSMKSLKNWEWNKEKLIHITLLVILLSCATYTVFTDINNFLAVYYPLIEVSLTGQLTVDLTLLPGNPTLGHVSCLIAGLFVGKKLQKRMISRN
ncbi:MAG: hypothetical protein ACFFD4_28100 [Candidatus Odinarchaeota archaeon]